MNEDGLNLLQVRLAMQRFADVQRPLPKVPAASVPWLEGVRVARPAPARVTEEELADRYLARLREQASRRPRRRGEPAAPGDEVVLDVLTLCRGALVPFATRRGLSAELAPDPLLPGFYEALAGAPVGSRRCVEVQLPRTYPVSRLRGERVELHVKVRAAFQLEPLDGDEEATCRRVFGEELAEVMERLAAELAEEHACEARREYIERVLDHVAERVRCAMPAASLDAELKARWAELELPLLAAHGLHHEVLEQAWETWRGDPMLRRQAERRLRIAVALPAMLERERLAPIAADHEAAAEVLAGAAGASLEDIDELLLADAALEPLLRRLAHYLAGVQVAVEQVEPV